MALRGLVGKLRVLPERAAASRAFASQSQLAGSFSEMMEESKRRHMEKNARMKRNSTVGIVLGTAGIGALIFYATCVVEAIFDDDL